MDRETKQLIDAKVGKGTQKALKAAALTNRPACVVRILTVYPESLFDELGAYNGVCPIKGNNDIKRVELKRIVNEVLGCLTKMGIDNEHIVAFWDTIYAPVTASQIADVASLGVVQRITDVARSKSLNRAYLVDKGHYKLMSGLRSAQAL